MGVRGPSTAQIDVANAITGVVPIANGGTASSTALGGSKVMVSNASAVIESAVSTTQLGYINTLSSAAQAQIDLKAPLASPTFSGTITTPLTANSAVTTGTGGALEASSTTKTQLSYLNAVTSSVQSQIDGKADLGAFTNASISGDFTVTAAYAGVAGAGMANVTSFAVSPTLVSGDEVEIAFSFLVALPAAGGDIVYGYRVDAGTPVVLGYAVNQDASTPESRQITAREFITGLSAGSHTFTVCASSGSATDPTIKGTSGGQFIVNNLSAIRR